MAAAAVEINLVPFSFDEDVVFAVTLGTTFATAYTASSPSDLSLDYAVSRNGFDVLTLTINAGLELDTVTGDLTVRIARGTLAPSRYDHLLRMTRLSTDEARAIFGGHLTIAKGAF